MADGSRDVAGASSGNRGYWRMTDAAGKRTPISALPLETSPSVKASRKMPQLDGLRAFAALAVLFNHLSTIRRTGSIRCRGHTVAFSYFFVLSGGAAGRLLTLPPLLYLGKISYDVCLFHALCG